jgi:hypothetical protein
MAPKPAEAEIATAAPAALPQGRGDFVSRHLIRIIAIAVIIGILVYLYARSAR